MKGGKMKDLKVKINYIVEEYEIEINDSKYIAIKDLAIQILALGNRE